MSRHTKRYVSMSNVRCHAKSIVRVSKLRRDAAPRRAPRHLDVMPPRAAFRRPPLAVLRSLRILERRYGVIDRIVPITAPLVHIPAHVEQTITIRLAQHHRLRPVLEAIG